jgi:hypothetical protein
MAALRTLVLGASPEPTRYAHLAALRLLACGHPLILVGKQAGSIGGVPINQRIPEGVPMHTVTMYLNPRAQEAWHEGLIALAPQRIIFNPGAEHPAFARRAQAAGIETVEGCTLVMLASGQY